MVKMVKMLMILIQDMQVIKSIHTSDPNKQANNSKSENLPAFIIIVKVKHLTTY